MLGGRNVRICNPIGWVVCKKVEARVTPRFLGDQGGWWHYLLIQEHRSCNVEERDNGFSFVHVEFLTPMGMSNNMGLEPKREMCARDKRMGSQLCSGYFN